MPERIANKIILAEDVEQQNLVRRYLERCGHGGRLRLVDLPADDTGGSGEKYVRDQFARQVHAYRSSVGKRASALLIVVVDADQETTRHRAAQLSDALTAAGMEQRSEGELIAVLIPKRHVETWIRALLGEQVNEEDEFKYPEPTSKQILQAAETLYGWTRPGAEPGPTSPASLTKSIPEWQKIPS